MIEIKKENISNYKVFPEKGIKDASFEVRQICKNLEIKEKR